MFGYRLELNGFTRGKCIRLYAGYSSSKGLNNYNKSSNMFAFYLHRRRKLLGRAGRGPPTFWPSWAAATLGPPTFSDIKT